MNGHRIVYVQQLCVNWNQQTAVLVLLTIMLLWACFSLLAKPVEIPHVQQCLCVHWVHENTLHSNGHQLLLCRSHTCACMRALDDCRWLFTVFMYPLSSSKDVCYSLFIWKACIHILWMQGCVPIRCLLRPSVMCTDPVRTLYVQSWCQQVA